MKLSALSPKPKRVCAIDASTNSLAFAVFNEEELESFGKILFSGKNNYEKVADSCKKTKAFFEQFDQIDAAVIEHTIFLNSPKTVSDLALVQGSLLGAMSLAGIKEIKATNPIAWQSFIGNGRLSTQEKNIIRSDNPNRSDSWHKNNEREYRKQRTIRFVNTIYDRNISDNDVADAIGIGHYAINNWSKLS
jgi:Holliday junction resolvasome RuvABC endonuclease subunit